jgi:3-oxoacyl-[acyl-carrier protein] reductase
MSTYLFAGASSAMAKATAILLINKGHQVIGISTHEVDGIYNKLYPIEKYGFGQFPIIETSLDGIIYFPGTINLKPIGRLSEIDFKQDYEINALGAAAFVQAYLPQLKKSDQASIVFISSVAAQMGMPFHSSIAMAKGALEGLTKSLAAELAPSVRVNCIAPSLVDTPLGSKFLGSPEKIEQMEKRNPMRKVGTINDMAEALSFLLLPTSAWLTGQVIALDGGMGTIKNG